MLIKTNDLNKYSEFKIIAQNMESHEIVICSDENHDEEIFEIPVDFQQICLPATYGKYLNWATIQIILNSQDSLYCITSDKVSLTSLIFAMMDENDTLKARISALEGGN